MRAERLAGVIAAPKNTRPELVRIEILGRLASGVCANGRCGADDSSPPGSLFLSRTLWLSSKDRLPAGAHDETRRHITRSPAVDTASVDIPVSRRVIWMSMAVVGHIWSDRMAAYGHERTFASTVWRFTTLLYPFRNPVSYPPMHLPVAPGTAWAMSSGDCGKYCRP